MALAETMSLLAAIAGIALLLFCSAMVAGSENAFFSLKKEDLDGYRNDHSKKARAIIYLLNHPKVLLATILITNNFINIAFVILSESIFHLFLNEWVLTTTFFFLFRVVFVTFIIVFLAEITPKIYATQNFKSFSEIMAVPMRFLSRLWKPLVWVLVKSTAIIDKRITRRGHELTIDDLEHAIDLTTGAHSPEEEKEVLKNIVNFGNTEVRQIMKSRMDVKALPKDTSFEEVIEKIRSWEYSRVPVYDGNFDSVKGILNIKDLLPHLHQNNSFNWQDLIRAPYFVPETKKIDDLLREFQQKRVHMAVVVDEYGGSSGIVTMEDILEEIFGEIHDEFDEEEITYSKLDEHIYVFEGQIPLNDVCRIMELRNDAFDDIRGEAETLGGMIIEMAGRIPGIREKISHDEFIFTVESADKRRLKRIKVEQLREVSG